MLLTGLFAISFAEHSETLAFRHMLNLGLLIAIGMCLDLCKFLFWRFHSTHVIYLVLSLALMGFSCVASIAFFVSNESASISKAQRSTPEYRAHALKVEQLQREIQQNETLAATRANSQYHEQWDKSQLLQEKIHTQTKQLAALIESSNNVGVSSARLTLTSSAFFLRMSQVLDSSFERIVIVAYSLLAIFIEVSALGLISLSTHTTTQRTRPEPGNDKSHDTHTSHFDQEENTHTPLPLAHERKATIQLQNQQEQRPDALITLLDRARHDIQHGNVAPHIRQITSLYGIERENALRILHHLVDEGFLEKRGVRFYTIQP